MVTQIPLGRKGLPEDVGPVAVSLASDDARWIWRRHLRFPRTPLKLNAGIQFGSEVSYLAIGERYARAQGPWFSFWRRSRSARCRNANTKTDRCISLTRGGRSPCYDDEVRRRTDPLQQAHRPFGTRAGICCSGPAI
jgi:hypothetical protein